MNFFSNEVCGKIKLRILYPIAVVLVLSASFSSCENTDFFPPPVYTDFSRTIGSAISLLSNTREGAGTGEQARGSKKILSSAITAAQTTLSTTGVTQAQLDAGAALLVTAMNTYKSSITPTVDLPNLAGQWTFDLIRDVNDQEPVPDHSGKGRNATMRTGHPFWGRGTPTFGTDRYGEWPKALHFDGGANIEIPFNADFSSPRISVSLWIRVDAFTPNRNGKTAVSLNRSNGFQTGLDIFNNIYFTVNPAESPSSYITEVGPVAPQNTWQHFVMTFGDGHMKFYVNGALVKDSAHNGTVLAQTQGVGLVIGQDLPTDTYSTNPASPFYVNTGGYFTGYLDEIRIYKSVLTADQALTIYNLEKP